MQHADIFHTCSEVAVALAGFSTIVNVFGRRERQWTVRERLYLSFVLESGLGALFMCLLALLLDGAGVPGRWLWGVGTPLFALTLAGVSWFAITRMQRAGLPDGASPLGRMVLVGDVLLVGLGLANAWFALEVVYLALVIWQLMSCALFFVVLLGFRPKLDR